VSVVESREGTVGVGAIAPAGAVVTARIGLVCVENPRESEFLARTSTLLVLSPIYNTGCKERSTFGNLWGKSLTSPSTEQPPCERTTKAQSLTLRMT
jgi:hypothetical protein